LGIGDWGLGIGDWAQSPIPNPQSPIPNPQSPFLIYILEYIQIKKENNNKYNINIINKWEWIFQDLSSLIYINLIMN